MKKINRFLYKIWESVLLPEITVQLQINLQALMMMKILLSPVMMTVTLLPPSVPHWTQFHLLSPKI